MNIKTTRFGEIEINDDKIIEFEQGIPGFDEEKQFVIIPYDEKKSIFIYAICKTGRFGVFNNKSVSYFCRL